MTQSVLSISNLANQEAPCAHWWQMWRASVLFPPPGAPSIRHTLPGGGGGSTTRGGSDRAGSGKRLWRSMDSL